MTRGTSRRSAVVGDRRPLERNLSRFLLEERGFVVSAEAATAADTARAVQQHHPDVVLVHEDVANEPGSSLMSGIRTSSPKTRVILLTSDRAAADAALVAAADAVVEEGPGLKELEFALTGRRLRPAARTLAGPVAFAAVAAHRPPRIVKERGWVERLQGAAAASIIVLAVVLARGVGTPDPQPEGPARIHIVAAEHALDTLEARAPGGAGQLRRDRRHRAAVDGAAGRGGHRRGRRGDARGPRRGDRPDPRAAARPPAHRGGRDAHGRDRPGPPARQRASARGLALARRPSPSPNPAPEPTPESSPEPTPGAGGAGRRASPTAARARALADRRASDGVALRVPVRVTEPLRVAERVAEPDRVAVADRVSVADRVTEPDRIAVADRDSIADRVAEPDGIAVAHRVAEPDGVAVARPSRRLADEPSPTESPTPTESPDPQCGWTGTSHSCQSPGPKDHTPPPKEDDADPSLDPGSGPTAGTVYVVPPGIVLLVGASGLARRLSRRRDQRR